jgi:hypothetical protein
MSRLASGRLRAAALLGPLAHRVLVDATQAGAVLLYALSFPLHALGPPDPSLRTPRAIFKINHLVVDYPFSGRYVLSITACWLAPTGCYSLIRLRIAA